MIGRVHPCTHICCGYKFCIGIDANGHGTTQGDSVNVELWSMEGEYDDQLKWPVTATVYYRAHQSLPRRK